MQLHIESIDQAMRLADSNGVIKVDGDILLDVHLSNVDHHNREIDTTGIKIQCRKISGIGKLRHLGVDSVYADVVEGISMLAARIVKARYVYAHDIHAKHVGAVEVHCGTLWAHTVEAQKLSVTTSLHTEWEDGLHVEDLQYGYGKHLMYVPPASSDDKIYNIRQGDLPPIPKIKPNLSFH